MTVVVPGAGTAGSGVPDAGAVGSGVPDAGAAGSWPPDPGLDRLWAEIVFIAYYLHWSFDSILELDHRTRARVIHEIGLINARLDAPVEGEPAHGWEG